MQLRNLRRADQARSWTRTFQDERWYNMATIVLGMTGDNMSSTRRVALQVLHRTERCEFNVGQAYRKPPHCAKGFVP